MSTTTQTTTTNTEVTEVTEAGSARRPARRSVLRLAAVALAMFMAFGATIGATASPASAATSGNVSFCLKYSNGSPYASKPVYLYRWTGSNWGSGYYKSGSTNAQGCATWRNLPTGYTYLTQGHWAYQVGWSVYAWTGYTGSVRLPSTGGTVTQSTGTVYFSQLY